MDGKVQWRSAGLQSWADAQTVMCAALRHLLQQPWQPYLRNNVQSPVGLPTAAVPAWCISMPLFKH